MKRKKTSTKRFRVFYAFAEELLEAYDIQAVERLSKALHPTWDIYGIVEL